MFLSRLIAMTIILFFLNAFAYATNSPVRTIGPQSEFDASHDYFTNLLSLALEQAGSSRKLSIIEHPGQGRALQLLRDADIYDVLWTGQSLDRDAFLLKIPIPLFLGGLGIRGSIVKSEFLPTFEAVRNIRDLQKYIACQGRHWPDADKLSKAGLQVFRVGHFDAMLKMIDLGRCDYLPLSIFEGEGELSKVLHLYPNLKFTTKVLFEYEQNMHFYVNARNQSLAELIQTGLTTLQTNGKLRQFMEQHPLTKSAFPLKKYEDSYIINLDGSRSHLLSNAPRY